MVTLAKPYPPQSIARLSLVNNKKKALESMPEWHALLEHYQDTKHHHMRDQFSNEPSRFQNFSLHFDDILFDYSKNRINQQTISLLTQLANACQLPEQIEAMFKGDKINSTENREVLHTALRYQGNKPLMIDSVDVHVEVRNELTRIKSLSEKIRNGDWSGTSGKPITDVVNIGIGGSHLGPQMVTEALKPFVSQHLNMHFVANVDENEIDDVLQQLNPETTLFIICSKTFTTQETMLNANTARAWFLRSIADESQLAKHFVAVSTNLEAALVFGIEQQNVFTMWDWVGGRYSLWSAIGLSVTIAIGFDNFEQLLTGAYEIDQHFQQAPLEKNIPVLMGLLGIWYNNFYSAQSMAVLPYAQHLHRFPAYLQQADMESNGKSVSINGDSFSHSTGPVLFGELGNPGQHAFYQLLHQGTKLVPIDVLAALTNISGENKHQDALMSNVLAQTEALMRGKNKVEVDDELAASGLSQQQARSLSSHKVFSGNRPSNTFLFKKLDPKTLGSLIAMYEHKIFVQGVIWNINSFDQWGVELGKQLATTILSELDVSDSDQPNRTQSNHDSSTVGLIKHYKQHRSS